jgi:hypothetical protein
MPKNFAHLGGLNAYEILGVEPTATAEEIEAAYRSAIKRQHSDTGGVTRLAQLVNDARDALVKDRASYDAWLREQGRPRTAEPKRDPEPAPRASDSSRFSWAEADDLPHDEPWDPWDTVAPQASPQTPPRPRNQPGGTTARPERRKTPLSPEERRSGYVAVLAAVLCGPVGLWLGIRSYRRAGSATSVIAIVIGGMSVLYLVSLVIAILLSLFHEPSSSSSLPQVTVMNQSQVVSNSGTRVVRDDVGTSLAPITDGDPSNQPSVRFTDPPVSAEGRREVCGQSEAVARCLGTWDKYGVRS